MKSQPEKHQKKAYHVKHAPSESSHMELLMYTDIHHLLASAQYVGQTASGCPAPAIRMQPRPRPRREGEPIGYRHRHRPPPISTKPSAIPSQTLKSASSSPYYPSQKFPTLDRHLRRNITRHSVKYVVPRW